ncbi:MAG: hypothetical protein ABR592_01135 [Nitriliruptorales bacterium]
MANRIDVAVQTSPLHPEERPVRSELWTSPLLLSVAAGVLVAAVVLAIGILVLVRQGASWSATASIVVLPVKELEPETQAGYYETLSRGQVVATFAEMLRLRRFETAVADKLRLSPSQRRQVKITVGVVPDTAIITVTARSADPRLAEEMVDHLVDAWDLEVWHLSTPYVPSILSWASGTARRSGTEPLQLGTALVFVALVTGLAVQQGTLQVGMLLARRREEDELEAPPPPPPPDGTGSELDELEAALFERWWKPGLFGPTSSDVRRPADSAQQSPPLSEDKPPESDDRGQADSLRAARDTRTV